MKKPLIVLVDDQPAVLEALEATLAPAFGQVSRIVAFDNPRHVLPEALRWAEEKRPIAVVIADQKMPGLSGVELVRDLRQHTVMQVPFRALMLTGYGGLDSALDSKNHAAVDRYVEKPWDSSQLHGSVKHLFESFLLEAGLLRYLEQRPVDDPETLVGVFRLRYRVYRMTPPLDTLLRSNSDEADLDGYDRRSTILGLFLRENNAETLVGTLRLATRKPSHHLEPLREASRRLSEAGGDLERELTVPFPIMKVFRDQARIEAFILKLEENGSSVTEVGRHAILPDQRRGNTDRRQTEGAVAYFSSLGLDYAVAGIPPLHRRHYVRLGFQEIPDVRREEGLFPAMAIWTELDRVRQPVRDRIETLRQRLAGSPREDGPARTAALCFCTAYPDCIPGPYESGDFSGTDILCPLRAETLLNPQEDGDDENGGNRCNP